MTYKYDGAKLGKAIIEKRKRNALSQKQAARALSLSEGTIWGIERRHHEPKIKTLALIASWLGKNPSDFFVAA